MCQESKIGKKYTTRLLVMSSIFNPDWPSNIERDINLALTSIEYLNKMVKMKEFNLY